jgi:hypothetical protein
MMIMVDRDVMWKEEAMTHSREAQREFPLRKEIFPPKNFMNESFKLYTSL